MRIAFLSPMKPLDAATPSGDRSAARAMAAALAHLGHEVRPVSRLSTYLHDSSDFAQRQAAAMAEATDLARQPRADLVFASHVYYRAPDLVGAELARLWKAPYVAAEASWARKRATGEWAEAAAHVARTLTRANAVLAATPRDAAGLADLVPADRLFAWPPFIDTAPFAAWSTRRAQARACWAAGAQGPVLLAVGMMRPRRKPESYALLAQSLALLPRTDWTLLIAGDGPERAPITGMLADLAGTVRMLGRVDAADMPALYAAADVFVWPGIGEAYGMVYLEAAAAGTPALACDNAGVAAAVAEGVSGHLTRPDPADYSARLAALLADEPARRALGASAACWAAEDRGLPAAAARLAGIFAATGLA